MWILWVVVGVVGLLPPLMLMLYRPKSAGVAGGLHYSRAARIFLGLVGLSSLAIATAAPIGMLTSARPVEWYGLVSLPFMLVWGAGALWILGDVWFVRHEFTERGLDYRSPWSRHRFLRWEDIVEVRWRPTAQWIDLRDAHGGVFHLSTMLAGIGPFCALALRRLPERARKPETIRILESVSSGHTAELTGMQRL